MKTQTPHAKSELIHFSLITHHSLLWQTVWNHFPWPPFVLFFKCATRSLSSFCQKALYQRSFLFTSLSNSISLQLVPGLPLGIKASHIFFAFVQRVGLRARGYSSTVKHMAKQAWNPGFDLGHQEKKKQQLVVEYTIFLQQIYWESIKVHCQIELWVFVLCASCGSTPPPPQTVFIRTWVATWQTISPHLHYCAASVSRADATVRNLTTLRRSPMELLLVWHYSCVSHTQHSHPSLQLLLLPTWTIQPANTFKSNPAPIISYSPSGRHP